MPVQSCNEGNKPGYKYGEHGHCYTYTPNDEESRKRAREKAALQGRAIEWRRNKARHSAVQSLIFKKDKFSIEEAKAWANQHDFKSGDVEDRDTTIKLRQFPSSKCLRAGGMKELDNGVLAYICPTAGTIKKSLDDISGRLDNILIGIKGDSIEEKALPSVKPNESESDYVKRCFIFEHERSPDRPKDQVLRMCYEKYRESTGAETPAGIKDIEKSIEIIKKNLELIRKTLRPGYYSKAKPKHRGYFPTLEGELKSIGWDKKSLSIECKYDGVRISPQNIGGAGYIFVDPELLKRKSPDIGKKFKDLSDEIARILPNDTVLDAELIGTKDGKSLHRTVVNGIINSKKTGLSKYLRLVCFDILFYKGEDLRKYPLHERLEYLQRLKSSEHLKIARITTDINSKGEGYIIKGINNLKKAIENIKQDRNTLDITGLSEGILIKDTSFPYEYPQNSGMLKAKWWKEFDGRILDKHLIAGTKNTYNYLIGWDIPKVWYDSLVGMSQKDWYHSVGILSKGKFYRGKDSISKNGKYQMVLGRTDSSKEDETRNIDDILRINAEEYFRFDNKEHPKYPRYSFYVARVDEIIKEKSSTDSQEVLEKLSEKEPGRIPIEELEKQETEQDSPLVQEEIPKPSGSTEEKGYDEVTPQNVEELPSPSGGRKRFSIYIERNGF